MAIEHFEFNTKARALSIKIKALEEENKLLKKENEALMAKKNRKKKEE